MIIVNTDILAYYLIRGERTAKARQLREFDSDWRAPSLRRAVNIDDFLAPRA